MRHDNDIVFIGKGKIQILSLGHLAKKIAVVTIETNFLSFKGGRIVELLIDTFSPHIDLC